MKAVLNTGPKCGIIYQVCEMLNIFLPAQFMPPNNFKYVKIIQISQFQHKIASFCALHAQFLGYPPKNCSCSLSPPPPPQKKNNAGTITGNSICQISLLYFHILISHMIMYKLRSQSC